MWINHRIFNLQTYLFSLSVLLTSCLVVFEQAGVNFDQNGDIIIAQLAGKLPEILPNIPKLPVFIHNHLEKIPEEFDARDHWPNCTTIGRVQDQGACKAGWVSMVYEWVDFSKISQI